MRDTVNCKKLTGERRKRSLVGNSAKHTKLASLFGYKLLSGAHKHLAEVGGILGEMVSVGSGFAASASHFFHGSSVKLKPFAVSVIKELTLGDIVNDVVYGVARLCEGNSSVYIIACFQRVILFVFSTIFLIGAK